MLQPPSMPKLRRQSAVLDLGALDQFNIRKYTNYTYMVTLVTALGDDYIAKLPTTTDAQKELIACLQQIKEIKDKKISTFSHDQIEALYERFQNAVEKVAAADLNQSNPLYDKLFIHLYENDNKVFDRIYAQIIDKTGASSAPNPASIKHIIATQTTKPEDHPNSHMSELKSITGTGLDGREYNPMHETNVPYIAFQGEQNQGRTCIRMGNQTHGANTLNAKFERYLVANARRDDPNSKNAGKYKYVYFNDLKTDPDRILPSSLPSITPKGSEGKRTTALHSLNEHEDYHIAVITMPADGSFFIGEIDKKTLSVHHEREDKKCSTLLAKLQKYILNDKHDFLIPQDVKDIVFGQDAEKRANIESLFLKAIKDVLPACCDMTDDKIKTQEFTELERNAILFHFIKFTLTNEILDKLNPNAYNTTCKDGIDRGGVHNLWYHLNLRFQLHDPMGKDEFCKLLDAAPIVAKFRPLNENRNLLWNALNHRMKDPLFAKAHAWAFDWLVANKPSAVELGDVSKPKATSSDRASDQQHKAYTPSADVVLAHQDHEDAAKAAHPADHQEGGHMRDVQRLSPEQQEELSDSKLPRKK